jgi:hypothetical protein
MSVGIDVSGRVILPYQLQTEIEGAGIPLPHGLTIQGPPSQPPVSPPPLGTIPPLPDGTWLFTYDDQMQPCDLPPGAADIVANYTPHSP